MISNDFQMVDPAKITITNRQRSVVQTEGLIESIRANGVLLPAIVTRDLVLVAGERRLRCALALAHSQFPVRFVDQLAPEELSILELEENVKRSELGWVDMTKAMGAIHQAYVAKDPDWTQAETAAALCVTQALLSIYLKVFREIGEDWILNSSSIKEAYNKLARRDQRREGAALEELLEPTNAIAPRAPKAPDLVPWLKEEPEPEPSAPIPLLPWPESKLVHKITEGAEPRPSATQEVAELLAPEGPAPLSGMQNLSFLEWAPTYTGPKFNLLHCDFPYGIGVFEAWGSRPQMSKDRHGDYSDSEDTYFALLNCLCEHMENFLSISAHVMFWFSEKHRDRTMRVFQTRAPSIVWSPFPLIWFKSDNSGIAGDVRRHPRHVYETCLLGIRSGRNLVKVASDCYAAPTDKRLHVSTKPEPMLRHFMSMMVDQNSSLLDPTAGSGAALRAAESLGAARVLGLEIDPGTCELAAQALHNSRLMRSL